MHVFLAHLDLRAESDDDAVKKRFAEIYPSELRLWWRLFTFVSQDEDPATWIGGEIDRALRSQMKKELAGTTHVVSPFPGEWVKGPSGLHESTGFLPLQGFDGTSAKYWEISAPQGSKAKVEIWCRWFKIPGVVS